MLSYSTGESGTGADVEKVRAATALVRERASRAARRGPDPVRRRGRPARRAHQARGQRGRRPCHRARLPRPQHRQQHLQGGAAQRRRGGDRPGAAGPQPSRSTTCPAAPSCATSSTRSPSRRCRAGRDERAPPRPRRQRRVLVAEVPGHRRGRAARTVAVGLVSEIGGASRHRHEVRTASVTRARRRPARPRARPSPLARAALAEHGRGFGRRRTSWRSGTGSSTAVRASPSRCSSTTRCSPPCATLAPLAPLHNPANVEGDRARAGGVPGRPARRRLRHRLPPHPAAGGPHVCRAARRGATSTHVRRYGFHGSSYAWVSRRTAELLGRPAAGRRGWSCSTSATAPVPAPSTAAAASTPRWGSRRPRGWSWAPGPATSTRRSAATSRGWPGCRREDYDRALNRESGLLGLAGVSDFRTLLERRAAGDADAALAFDVTVHRIRKYVGAYAAVLGRLDALVFTGGIGERSAVAARGRRRRARACSGCGSTRRPTTGRPARAAGVERGQRGARSGSCRPTRSARSRGRRWRCSASSIPCDGGQCRRHPATSRGAPAPRVAPWRRPSTAAGGCAPRTATMPRPSSSSTAGSRWLGDEAGADRHADAVDAVVDLDGALVLPAFVDAHAHLSHTGMGLRGVDLAGTTSVTQALRAVEDAVRRRGGRPVFALNWQEHDWAEDRAMTAAELDRAALRRRRLRLADRRALGRGLQRAGRRSPGPTGSTAGWATGSSPATPRTPPGPPSTPPAAPTSAARTSRTPCGCGRARGIAAACTSAAARCSPRPDDFADVLELGRRPDLPRTVGYWAEAVTDPEQARALVALHGAAGLGGDLNIDGSIGSHTAHLRDALRRRPRLPRHGLPLQRRRARPRRRLRAGRHPERVPRHRRRRDGHRARGLRGRRRRSSGSTSCGPAGPGWSTPRWSTPRASRRMARLGMVASVQPAFDAFWGGAGRHVRGPPRAATGCRAPTRSPRCAAAGVRLALGSDSPVTPFDPWAAVRAAVEHHDPAQRLDVATALDAHTAGG